MISKMLKYWRNYGQDREKIKENVMEIRKENVRLLRDMSIVVILIIVIYIWFPLLIKQSTQEVAYYLMTAFGSAIVFFVSNHMIKNEKSIEHTALYKTICVLFMHLTLFFGIYVGVVKNSVHIAGLYLMILLWVEMNFVISAIDNLIIGLSSVLIFILLSYMHKNFDIFIFDMANSMVAFVLSQASSWIIGKQRIEKIITRGELNEANDKLYWNSTHDPLTQLYNRRKFFEESEKYSDQDSCLTENILIGIMDIDYFKDYNDTFGHDQGDRALIELSQVLEEYCAKREVLLCRWGGEEFMCIMPLKDGEDIRVLGQRVIDDVHNKKMVTANTTAADYLSVSIGVAQGRAGEKFEWNTLYSQCDHALYKAKKHGRNRVETYQ